VLGAVHGVEQPGYAGHGRQQPARRTGELAACCGCAAEQPA
jgi:hypothetical protein